MADDLVIVPSDGDGFVELARTKQGRLFRKHILTKGDLLHPKTGQTISVDDTFFDTLTKNFDAGVCPIVQVPLADGQNRHTEDPDRNIGEVIGVETKDDKFYAIIDAREKADKVGKTLLGASAMLDLDYTDTKSGKKVGPTLLHTCVTNRPYVTDLDDYEEIVAATADTSERAVLLTPAPAAVAEPEQKTKSADKETGEMGETTATETAAKTPSLDELLAALKKDHNIDVAALQAQAADGEKTASLSQALVDALTTAGVVKLTNTGDDKPSTEDVVGAVAELATSNVALTNRVQGLERKDAENAVDALIVEGRILPAERDARVELKLSNSEMFDRLLPAKAIVALTKETGVTPPQDEAQKKDLDADIVRLSQLANSLRGVVTTGK